MKIKKVFCVILMVTCLSPCIALCVSADTVHWYGGYCPCEHSFASYTLSGITSERRYQDQFCCYYTYYWATNGICRCCGTSFNYDSGTGHLVYYIDHPHNFVAGICLNCGYIQQT